MRPVCLFGFVLCVILQEVVNVDQGSRQSPDTANKPLEATLPNSADKHIPSEDSNTATKLWKFKVKYEPKYTEKVCIIGDCHLLGKWKAENLIPLSYDEVARLWYIDVNIPADRDVHYRYITCTSEIVDHVQKTKVHQWETNFTRRVKQEETSNDSNSEYDVFGKFDGRENLENGWLIDDFAVYIRLNSKSIEWLSAETSSRRTTITLRNSRKYLNDASSNSNRSSDIIFITTNNDGGKFHKQDPDGYSYYDTDQAVFMTRTFTADNQEFVFEFTDTKIKSGYSHLVLSQEYHCSMGNIKIPIHSADHKHYLGNLNVNYLIIRPPPSNLEFTCKSSFAKYWNNSWTPLEIGHRGSGMSYSNSPAALLNHKHRENTIASFKSAGEFGANLVEFDVQLTSDLVPTVYHDFNVMLEVQHKNPNSKRKLILPFSELSLGDLKDFKTQHVKEINVAVVYESEEGEESTPFPTLKEVLNSIDPAIGFNIEIKHTSQSHDGDSGFYNAIDMNVYVDRILEVVFENAGSRYIVFSSFSPNICLMARLKQNKYPVMLLTNPVRTPAPSFEERAKNIQTAIDFAKGADLLGIVAAAEDLVQNLQLVKMVLNSNLILFCWGDVFHDKMNIKLLKKHGVHGVIFDRIDQLGERLKKDILLHESILL